ncbi:hypothetical protein IRP63_05015 [Clostridium botulinum]|nr:hypothetical protein [Clostridium botulinum]MCD3233455.1 hypothetical protein [Clostridium botulinum D/C]MCD3239205.1 hypothetical protein [Clostridium botulinum D/C]MCD3266875.1 hypothetical protein [Clostridium botulinum D/C]MCD3301166.1 hypothetical protein [Clostridium botulinum D/C]MCD3305113.1 hypothetical protein [Clostridium botulinum D/C]
MKTISSKIVTIAIVISTISEESVEGLQEVSVSMTELKILWIQLKT